MEEWKDKVETLLTVSVAVSAVAVASLIFAASVGVFFGVAYKAFTWVQ